MSRRVLVSVVCRCAVPVLLAAMSQVATADPFVPTKVRTIPVRSPGAPADAPAASTEFPKVHVLTVRPSVPADERDASGRPLRDRQSSLNAAGEDDRKTVRTMPVRPEATSGTVFPDPRGIRTTPLHAQSPQQDTPDMTGSRATRGPMADHFGGP